MVASHMIQSPRSNILNAPRAGSASDAPPQNDGSEQAIASRILQSGNPQELQAAQAGQMGAGVQAAVASLMSRQPSSSAKPPPRAPLSGLHSVAPWTKPPATAPGGPTDAPAPSAAPSPAADAASQPSDAAPSAAPTSAPPDAASAAPAAVPSPASDATSPTSDQAADPLASSAPPAAAPAQDQTTAPLATEPPAAASDVCPPLAYQPISSDIASRFEKCTGENVSSVCIAENPDLEKQGKRGVAIDGECIEVAPGLLGDLNLCSHELTHIVQQRGPLKQPSKSKKRSAEGEAKSAAKAVVADQKFSITVSSSESQLFEADDDADTQDNEQGSDTAGGEEGPSDDILSAGTLDCDSSGCDSPKHAASQPEPEPEITKKIDEPCLTPCMKAGRENGTPIPYDTSTLEGTYLANAEADYQRQQNLKYAYQSINGCIQGDLIDNPTGFNTFGQTVCSVAPPADVRDFGVAVDGIRQGKTGAWGNLVLSGIGFWPVAGDAIKAAARPILRGNLPKIDLNGPPGLHPHHTPRPDPANIDADNWPSSPGGPPAAAQSGDLVNNAESLADTKKAGETTIDPHNANKNDQPSDTSQSPNAQHADQQNINGPRKILTDNEILQLANARNKFHGPGSCKPVSQDISEQIEGSSILEMVAKDGKLDVLDGLPKTWGDIHYGVLLPDKRVADGARGTIQKPKIYQSQSEWIESTVKDRDSVNVTPKRHEEIQKVDTNQTVDDFTKNTTKMRKKGNETTPQDMYKMQRSRERLQARETKDKPTQAEPSLEKSTDKIKLTEEEINNLIKGLDKW